MTLALFPRGNPLPRNPFQVSSPPPLDVRAIPAYDAAPTIKERPHWPIINPPSSESDSPNADASAISTSAVKCERW